MHDIFILTDSLALPRSKPEQCEWSKTWPNLLRLHGYSVYQVSIGGATVGELHNQYLYHKETPSKILIIQSGIVDCTPRFLSKNSVNILKSLPIIGSLILSFFNRPMIRRIRRIKYTPLNDFKRKMISLKKTPKYQFTVSVLVLSLLNTKRFYLVLQRMLKYTI